MLDVTAAGVTGVVVLMARVMQAASFLLMAGITWANAKAFRYGGDDLGYIGTMITEENYGLGLYVGIGVFLVLWARSGACGFCQASTRVVKYGCKNTIRGADLSRL